MRPFKSKNRISTKLTVQDSINRLKNIPYKYGGNGVENSVSLDCLGLLVVYCRNRYGRDLMAVCDLELFDLYNYAEIFNESNNHLRSIAMLKLIELLDLYFIKVSKNYVIAGDVIRVEADGEPSIGIYAGNQMMLITTPKTGSFLISTKYYEIKDAYRWLR